MQKHKKTIHTTKVAIFFCVSGGGYQLNPHRAFCGFLVPPPEMKKKILQYQQNKLMMAGKLFERPETVFSVRENYLAVRGLFSASGTIIWPSGNCFRRPGKLFGRPETVFGVRENYLSVRKLFSASGKIIWPSGNILNAVQDLLI